jgi:hypothetical protein
MQGLVELLSRFFRSFRLWVTVAPWEQAIRVRLGKHVHLLQPGIHLRIPFVDAVHVQSVRLRVSPIGRQTLTMSDGRTTVTLSGSLGYAVHNIEHLYRRMHHAEDTIQQIARGAIAQYVATSSPICCTPHLIEKHVGQTLDLSEYGLEDEQLHITDFAIVRTYRLIGDVQYGIHGSSLSTENPTTGA